MISVLINILLLLVFIGILVFVHEFGHFIAARMVGAKVFEFSLGMGPKLISRVGKKTGTEFSLRLFPIGGYVKILGDGDPSEEEKVEEDDEIIIQKIQTDTIVADSDSLEIIHQEEVNVFEDTEEENLKNKTKLQQIFVMSAGVLMNTILSIILYYIVIASVGWSFVIPYTFENYKPTGAYIQKEKIDDLKYSSLVEEGTAIKAGLPEEGYLKSLNDQEIEYFNDLTKLLSQNKGEDISLEVCVDDICQKYNVGVSEEGKIGLVIPTNYYVILSYDQNKLTAGFSHIVNTLRIVGIQFGELFQTAKETNDYSDISNTVSGPVGMYLVIEKFKEEGSIAMLNILADLSLSLVIMNILPIPALDGGRIFILIIESITRRELNEKVKNILISGSFVLLLLLMVVILVKDIVNFDSMREMFK